MPVGPSRTAEFVCLARAAERLREPSRRLVDDPYASLFLRPLLQATLATGPRGLQGPGLFALDASTFVLCRHRYIDDCLLKALAAGAEQVVVLGAGYDTRAYRFATEMEGRPLWELDFPATSRRKARLIQRHAASFPQCSVQRLQVDFERESFADRLLEAGFSPDAATFFIWEGVSMYLTRHAVKETLAIIRRLGGKASELVADFWYLVDSPDLLSTLRRLSPNLLAFLGEPVIFGIHPEDVVHFLGDLGFRVRQIAGPEEMKRRYLTNDDRRVYPSFYVARVSWNDA